MELFKDKFFAIPLTVAIVAAGLLVHRHFFSDPQQVSSATAQNIQSTRDPSSQPQAQNTQRTHTHHSSSSSTYSFSRSPRDQVIPVKKMRPKSGDNRWVVNKESIADSHDLTDVLKNMIDGDTISIGPGDFDFALGSISVSKLELNGVEGTTLSLFSTRNSKRDIDLIIRNVTLVVHEEEYWWVDRAFKKVELDHVNVDSLMKIDVRSNVELSVKDSNFNNASFSINDHAKAKFENTIIRNSDYLIRMDDFAIVEVIGGQLESFSMDAFYGRSQFVKLKVTGVKVKDGKCAFAGKFLDENTSVKDSEFTNLEKFSDRENNVKCSMCVMSNIQNER